jgi:hypothetical protein
LVSAFLNSLFPEGGLSLELFRFAQSNRFQLYIAEPILDEVRRILLEEERIRRKYSYTIRDVEEFIQSLKLVSLSEIQKIIKFLRVLLQLKPIT